MIRLVMGKPKLNTEEQILQLWFIYRKATPEEIALQMNLTVDQVKSKLFEYGITAQAGTLINETYMGIFTGRLHMAKADLISLLNTRKRATKVITRTEEVYAQTASINARIIKEILLEMETQDRDSEEFSAGAALGLTRKNTWLAAAKFGTTLYDIDTVYAERIDFMVKQIITRQDEFYFDEQSNPENWYPHRKDNIFAKYIFGRSYGKDKVDKINKTNGSITMEHK